MAAGVRVFGVDGGGQGPYDAEQQFLEIAVNLRVVELGRDQGRRELHDLELGPVEGVVLRRIGGDQPSHRVSRHHGILSDEVRSVLVGIAARGRHDEGGILQRHRGEGPIGGVGEARDFSADDDRLEAVGGDPGHGLDAERRAYDIRRERLEASRMIGDSHPTDQPSDDQMFGGRREGPARM